MIKMRDWYAAGIIIGAVAGNLYNLSVLLVKLLGINTTSPWGDISMILFKPPEVYWGISQFYGYLASLTGSMINGVLIALLIKFTGKDYLWIKSFSIGMATTIITFMILYPALDYHTVQHNPPTHYTATVCFIPYGFYVAYFFHKFTDFSD